MLSLSKIQKGHHGRLFVLGRIALEDLVYELVVLLRELERYGGVVLRRIPVLELQLLVSARPLWKSLELRGDSRHAGHR